jgi:hypothetical protein
MFWKGYVLLVQLKSLPRSLQRFYRHTNPDLLVIDGGKSKNQSPDAGSRYEILVSEISASFDEAPFVLVTFSEQVSPTTIGWHVSRYLPFTLQNLINYLPVLIHEGKKKGYNWEYIRENLDLPQNCSPEMFTACLEKKFYLVGYNTGLMLDVSSQDAKDFIDQTFENVGAGNWDLRNISPLQEHAKNALLIKLRDKQTIPLSAYVLGKFVEDNRSLASAYKLANGEKNWSQIGWLFDLEVKNRIKSHLNGKYEDFMCLRNNQLTRTGFTSNGIIRTFRTIAHLATVLSEEIPKLKNTAVGVQVDGCWLFPDDCRNGFFDFALLSKKEDNKVILLTFQVTISITHTKDGLPIQMVCQMLPLIDDKSKLDQVFHHAIVPTLAVCRTFRWTDSANLEQGKQTRQIAKDQVTHQLQQLQAMENSISDLTQTTKLSSKILGIKEEKSQGGTTTTKSLLVDGKI